jgi:hypothetical protein
VLAAESVNLAVGPNEGGNVIVPDKGFDSFGKLKIELGAPGEGKNEKNKYSISCN